MLTHEEILACLKPVMDPELHRSIVDLGMVQDIQSGEDGQVSFTLVLTVPTCPMRDAMARDARAALMGHPEVTSVDVRYGEMSPERRRELFRGSSTPAPPRLNTFNRVNRVIAVMSGKGGVGKSAVTALLASALAAQGQKVGILDADVTGPSIPKLFGLPPGGLRGNELGMLPAITANGIRVVSTNLMLPSEDAALIWRGPMITGTIRQFWEETLWGRLDALLVDLPPGTGDAALAVVQTLPLDGVLLVTSPQGLAALVVRKAVQMLHKLNTPILGVIENMSYFESPDTGQRYEIFGPSHADEIAAAAGAPLLARLPITPEIATLSDAGQAHSLQVPAMTELAANLHCWLPAKESPNRPQVSP